MQDAEIARRRLPLEGVKVIDVATLGAGPWLATRLADFGADVVKVEHPAGDPMRELGAFDGDVPLWWKLDSRNKRCITLDLSREGGQQVLRRLVRDADVLVENFRPGTMERWNLGYERLREENRRLIMVRVTGWGQDGPYSDRPGFGTLVEAASGWAHLNGFPENPPTLPPMALGDAVTAILGAYATMVALYERDALGGNEGQVVDLALCESLLSLIGQQVINYDRLGVVPQRTGNSLPAVAPRNVYPTSDDAYVALAASTPTIFERLMQAIGRPELTSDPRFVDNRHRLEHREELDEIIGDWMLRHSQQEVMDILVEHEAAVAPVYDVSQIFTDPHFTAREAIVSIDDEELGPTRTCAVFPRLTRTPGAVRHLGKASGADTDDVLESIGFTAAEIETLRQAKAI